MPVSKGRHGDPPSATPHALRVGRILVGRQAELACLGSRPALLGYRRGRERQIGAGEQHSHVIFAADTLR